MRCHNTDVGAQHAAPLLPLPRQVLALVLEWAALHRAELREGWERCRQHQQPRKIEPLA